MKELLFRGKSLNTDNWVYGFAFANQGPVSQLFCRNEENTERLTYNTIEVDTETIGMYSEMDGKGSRRLFSGDIVQIHENRFVIEFEKGQFILKSSGCPLSLYASSCEVIGNKFDNPDLL